MLHDAVTDYYATRLTVVLQARLPQFQGQLTRANTCAILSCHIERTTAAHPCLDWKLYGTAGPNCRINLDFDRHLVTTIRSIAERDPSIAVLEHVVHGYSPALRAGGRFVTVAIYNNFLHTI